MNNKIVGVIVIVVILLVAGVAVYLTMGGLNNENLRDKYDGRLTIFGNANEDDYINEDDIKACEEIIAGDRTPTYFDAYYEYNGKVVQMCLADANCDGVVDEEDLQLIEDLVDRKEGITVWFYDVDGVCASANYPLDTMAVGYKSNYEAILMLQQTSKVMYVENIVATDSTDSYYYWYHQYFPTAQDYGSRFTPDYEVFVQDGNTPPDAFITGTRAWFDPDMEETLSTLNVSVIRLPFWEDNITVSAILTLGWLLDQEDLAQEYAATADSVLDTIEDTLADVPLSQRPFVYASYNGTSISTIHNGIHEMVTAAGGRNPLDMGYASGSVDGEGIIAMDPDWIVLNPSGPYYGFLETYTTLADTKAKVYDVLMNTDNKYFKLIEGSNAYKNGNVLIFGQGIYMGPASYIAVAYLANHLYPDKFNFDVDALFADYLAKYHNKWSISDFAGIEYYEMQDVFDYYKTTSSDFSELVVELNDTACQGTRYD